MHTATHGRSGRTTQRFEFTQAHPGKDVTVYLEHWGLERTPFRPSNRADYFFAGDGQTEALARLDFVTEGPQRLALLFGESGTGKTTILHQAARQYRRNYCHTVLLNLLGLDDEEFVFQLADALGVDDRQRHSYATTWRGLQDQLQVNRCQNLKTILLFDDVDETGHEVLRNIVRLINWRPAEDTGMTVVLAANDQHADLLGRQLLELADLRIDVFPWEAEEVAEFLSQAITEAGRSEAIFDESAANTLFQLTGGNPRRVRQLAELALIAAAGQALTEIDADTILAVQDELSARRAAA